MIKKRVVGFIQGLASQQHAKLKHLLPKPRHVEDYSGLEAFLDAVLPHPAACQKACEM